MVLQCWKLERLVAQKVNRPIFEWPKLSTNLRPHSLVFSLPVEKFRKSYWLHTASASGLDVVVKVFILKCLSIGTSNPTTFQFDSNGK